MLSNRCPIQVWLPANKVCEGYVFTGVCLSTGGVPGRYPSMQIHPLPGTLPGQVHPLTGTPPSRYTSWAGTPPWVGTTPGRYTNPSRQVHPCTGTPPGRYTPQAHTTPRQVHTPWQIHPWAGTPPGRYTPWQAQPPGQVHPSGRYTPPGQVHPPGRYTPGQVHLLRQVHTPWAGITPQAGSPPPGHSACWNMVNKRAVRIPLECILVLKCTCGEIDQALCWENTLENVPVPDLYYNSKIIGLYFVMYYWNWIKIKFFRDVGKNSVCKVWSPTKESPGSVTGDTLS